VPLHLKHLCLLQGPFVDPPIQGCCLCIMHHIISW